MNKIPLIKPYVTDEVKAKVCEVLDSAYLTEGPVTHELEEQFRAFTGAKHAIAVTSCTTGLEIALRALDIGKGDEVIVPDYTYPATADVVEIVGAKIVIVDVSSDTMLVNYDALEKAITKKTKAIIPVSLFGNPLDYERLKKIKRKHKVAVIEDAACAIGAEYKGGKVGSFADITVFSLHPRKFITTGEGGIITTDNTRWAEWMNSYKHFGMGKATAREAVRFKRIGTNYKLSNIQSAVGVVQMRHVDELLSRRRVLAAQYDRLLAGVPGVDIPVLTPGGVHSYQSYCVFLGPRNKALASLRSEGIEVQIGTYSLHMHAAFKANKNCRITGKMKGSRFAFDHCLALPLFHDLSANEQQRVVDGLSRILSQEG
ncbi:MAG: DegT/DnrJ/EryC1/StrS aminotransferase family protein [Fibrobacterota bacterium]